MKFKLINEPTKEIMDILKIYCLKSKPFDFCELPSMTMRVFKINEYFNSLFKSHEVYTAENNGKIVGIGFFRKDEQNVYADFIVGFNNLLSFREISETFKNFRIFYKNEYPEVKLFCGEIYRVFKVKSYLKFIKKYMNPIKIDLDKERIMVYFD